MGRSNSGKTTLLLNLLLLKDFYYGYFDKVFVFSPTVYKDKMWRKVIIPRERKFTDYTDQKLNEIIKTNEREKLKVLVILTDCGAEDIKRGNYKNVLDKSMMNTRHDNISFILDAQNVCSLSTPTRQNCDGAAIFETLNYNEISALYKDFGKGRFKDFVDILEKATENPYSFLFVHRQGPKQTYFRKFCSILKWEETKEVKKRAPKRKIEEIPISEEERCKRLRLLLTPETDKVEQQKTSPTHFSHQLKTSNTCL